MIIVKLQGGLGNQMFQYACGRALSRARKVPLLLDISYYEREKLRTYLLDHFQIEASIATPGDLKKYKNKLMHLFEMVGIYHSKNHIREEDFSFNPEIFEIGDTAYLEGYWQSEKYFKDIESVIRKEFTLREPLHDNTSALILKMRGLESVSLHIRRSDYVTNSKVHAIHGTTSVEYYEQAVQYIKNQTQKPHLFIFSDDLEWAKENLPFDLPLTHISPAIVDYEAHYLMSLCKHNIIANSSFSWWAAWLNTNQDKMVIAPKNWFKDESKDTRDLLPNSWIKI